MKTVIFCGQYNIPLRGKRDDNPDNSNLQGNFQALLEFRIDSGDVKLKEHLENEPRNSTYRSKTIQNEIIETVGNYVSSKIIAEVKQTRMFSVMADERGSGRFQQRKPVSCPPLCRLFKEYLRGVCWFPPLWRRNNR